MKSPGSSALRGKWTHRNFWMGDSRLDFPVGSTLPSGRGKPIRFLRAKNLSPPGSLYSIANPTKSAEGLPLFQFMASSSMPSPR